MDLGHTSPKDEMAIDGHLMASNDQYALIATNGQEWQFNGDGIALMFSHGYRIAINCQIMANDLLFIGN